MNSRERVLSAARRQKPDRVPVALAFFPFTLPETGGRDADEYLNTDVRYVDFGAPSAQKEFLDYLEGLPADAYVGNAATLRNYAAWGYHPEIQGFKPLAPAQTVEELAAFRLPNFQDEDRHQHLSTRVAELHRRGLAVVGIPPHLGGEMFETAWRLRGFEEFLQDFYLHPDLVNYLFDQLARLSAESALSLARAGIDVLVLDDDVGMPSGMIIGPGTWREFLKPRLAAIIRAARAVKPDLVALYHSDGNIEPIVADLIEIGVDALNPLQPDVMDAAKLKDRFGDRLAFWGGVGTATLWAKGTPADIRAEVRTRIETLGRDGGYIVCPAYDLEPEIPWPNILAFVEAVKEFGAY